jgi:hypothetical protein
VRTLPKHSEIAGRPKRFFGFQLLLSLPKGRGEATVGSTSVWLDNMSSWLSKGCAVGHGLPALFSSSHSEELTCGGGLLTIYGMSRSLPDLREAIMKHRILFDEH